MHARGIRRGTVTKPLAVDRDMARWLLTAHPIAQCAFQSADIQTLEQLAPHRGAGTRARLIPLLSKASPVSRRPQRTIPNWSHRPDNSAATAINSRVASG
jgi:hypothetical protein